MPRQPPPAPRVERKPESKNVDDILKPPGRDSRPERVRMHCNCFCEVCIQTKSS